MLARRLNHKELMDDPSVPPESVHRALSELDIINAWSGGFAATARGVKQLCGKRAPRSILDVGAGGSTRLKNLAPWPGGVTVTSLDISPIVCNYRKDKEPGEAVVLGDARIMPFKESSFDIVHASLFLHHFTDDEIRGLLGKFLGIARWGVVINDLHRSMISLAGLSLLTRMFSRSHLVRHDGPLSVKRGFRKSELAGYYATLSAAGVTLRWAWAFRWLLVIRK